jgi:hypothetical protein
MATATLVLLTCIVPTAIEAEQGPNLAGRSVTADCGPADALMFFGPGLVMAKKGDSTPLLTGNGRETTEAAPLGHQASAAAIDSPTADPWSDYQIIVWQRQSGAGYRALKQIGITGGAVMSDRHESPGTEVFAQINAMLEADLAFYLENTATDFYSSYHRWTPGRPVNWRFDEAKRRYHDNPQDPAVLFREPSLSDPNWLDIVAERLGNTVGALKRYRPLFYNMADEPGIGDLAAFWDFDLSPMSLDAMRNWLKGQYGTLARLNEEWGSAFVDWDNVVPMTTPEAMRRSDQNFAAWADFKEWMDVSFARALKRGSDAVHAADPNARAAIEGGQIPGWGGYDYARLANSVDLIELGDEIDSA